jgi:hypothetical protein
MTTQRRLAFLAGTAVIAALALAPSGLTVGRYTDARGDGNGAPDITDVTVTSDANGLLTFAIRADGFVAGGDMRTYLVLDTDANAATGAPNTFGADYLFVVDESDNTYYFFRWDGTDWADTPSSTVFVASGTTAGVRISVNRSELGNTGAFNFWTRTRLGPNDSTTFDDAPDNGTWNYTLAAGGPEIRGVLVATKPGLGPKAGKAFTVSPVGLRLPTQETPVILPQPDSYTCKAKLGSKSLSGTGKGGCTWKLARSAKGKRLTVTLTVTYQGASLPVTLTYKVR